MKIYFGATGVARVLAMVPLVFSTSQAHAWVQSPRCTLDAIGPTTTADARTNWARSKKTQTGDSTFLSNAANQEIIANPTFHLYPIYSTMEGYSFRGPGPVYTDWLSPSGGYTAGTGPVGSMAVAGVNGLVSEINIQTVSAMYKGTGVYNEWVCQPGCYTPDQEVRFGSRGFMSFEKALNHNNLEYITTLTPDATLDKLWFMDNKIMSFTKDIEDTNQEILIFHMQSGGELKVTTQHPIVTEEGMIKPALDFTVGENLVREDGTFDEIVSINRVNWFGSAYHVRPDTTDRVSNVIVAQGYLNGSGRYQFEFLQELNRVILRENIPEDVLPL